METSPCPPDQIIHQAERHTTDDDMQRLLVEAESRLRARDSHCGLHQTTDEALIGATMSRIPDLVPSSTLRPYVCHRDEVALADSARMLSTSQTVGSTNSNSVKPTSLVDNAPQKERPTAGENWFNLPKTELTPELKRDFQLLRMRSVLDPKRHYKKENGKANIPSYSQVGVIVEGPTEFFSGRISKRDRKKTFVEEALALERGNGRFKAKYGDIQSSKQSGKKSYYKNLRGKRNNRGK